MIGQSLDVCQPVIKGQGVSATDASVPLALAEADERMYAMKRRR